MPVLNKAFIRRAALVALLLLAYQAARAAINLLITPLAIPTGSETLYRLCSMISFMGAAALFWLILKPSREQLSWFWPDDQRRRWPWIVGGFLSLLFIISIILYPQGCATNVEAVLLIPLIEETIFRGLVWSALAEKTDNQWVLIIITALLFGLWHLGYMDAFILRSRVMGESPNYLFLLGFKFLLGCFLGAVTGFLRSKTGTIWGGFYVHAFWNLFAK